MLHRNKILLILGFIPIAICVKLPSTITPCSRSDPGFNHCLKVESQKYLPEYSHGIPAWGVPSLDPLKIGVLEIHENGLDSHLTNLIVEGYASTRIQSFKIDFKNNTAQIIYNNKEFDIRGHYKVNGTLAVFPIKGSGGYSMKLFNIDSNVIFYFDIVKSANGKEYMKINSHELTYEVKDNAIFNLTNLFNGDKVFSETLLHFINENWRGIVADVSPSAFKAVVGKLLTNLNTFLAKLSLDELFRP